MTPSVGRSAVRMWHVLDPVRAVGTHGDQFVSLSSFRRPYRWKPRMSQEVIFRARRGTTKAPRDQMVAHGAGSGAGAPGFRPLGREAGAFGIATANRETSRPELSHAQLRLLSRGDEKFAIASGRSREADSSEQN